MGVDLVSPGFVMQFLWACYFALCSIERVCLPRVLLNSLSEEMYKGQYSGTFVCTSK